MDKEKFAIMNTTYLHLTQSRCSALRRHFHWFLFSLFLRFMDICTWHTKRRCKVSPADDDVVTQTISKLHDHPVVVLFVISLRINKIHSTLWLRVSKTGTGCTSKTKLCSLFNTVLYVCWTRWWLSVWQRQKAAQHENRIESNIDQ